jgi:hypothetical protein
LYSDRAPARVAALADAVLSDAALYDAVLKSQDAALARMTSRDFAGILLSAVEKTARAPRREPPRVTFDFWGQMQAAEQMDELRQLRPAAYEALPLAPDDPRATTGVRQSDFAT